MELNELITRSPIRIFEKSITGGLKAGEIGVIASQNGLGKTSVLVQLALDKLLQEKKVIHVSFTQHTHYVLAWYEDIFREFVSRKNLENHADVKNDFIKNRVLMNFNQDGISKEQILRSLRAMIIDGSFKADSVIIDGYNFSKTSHKCMEAVKAFAKELNLSVWYSCNIDYENNSKQCDDKNIPFVLKDFSELIDIIVVLEPKQDYIAFSVSKDRDSLIGKVPSMRLDPKTLLISEG